MKHIIWLLLWFIPFVAFSQEKATFSFYKKPARAVLFQIEKALDVRFSYADDIVKNSVITILKKEYTLRELLTEIEKNSLLKFEIIPSNKRYIIVKKKGNSPKIELTHKTQHLSEIILTDYLTQGISKHKAGFFKVNSNRLDILPGLTEGEILESIQQFPGVISPNETATGLIVRGGTADQNHTIWDNINLYHSGHLFGMISPFNPLIPQQISFYNKGTNPRFGDRISSVIDIKTNAAISKKLKAKVGLNAVSASAFLEVPLVKNKLSLQVSARRSFTDYIQSPSFNKLADKVFQSTIIDQNSDAITQFHFVDYNAKLNYQINKKNVFSISGIFINNTLDYETQGENNNTENDLLYIKNRGYALDYQTKWRKNIIQKSTLSFSEYRFNYNFITSKNSLVDGTNITEQLSNYNKRNVIFDTHIATEFEVKIANKNLLNMGYQYGFKDVGYAFLNEKKSVLVLDYDDSQIANHTLFVNYRFKTPQHWFKNPFEIHAGSRFSYFSTFNVSKFEPRLVINKKITTNLKLQFTGEIKNQIISQIDETVLSNLSLENNVWRLANNSQFPIINSNQISAGLIYQKKGWSFDADYYQKNNTGITALSLGFLNPDGQTFHIGSQKIKGVDFYAKKDFNHFNSWISYSFSDVKSQFDGLNNGEYFTANTSVAHALSTSLSYKTQGFQIALGWKWRTGKPYTQSISEGEEIHFNGINTERLPNYHRLDLATTYGFDFSKSNQLKAKVGFSIRNIYNQKNHLSREYIGFNGIDDPIKIKDRFSLGFTPNFSFLVYW